jgi:polysaccharide biosynthesis protein PslH
MARILILTPQLPYPPHSLTGRSQGTTIRNFHLIAGLARRHSVDLLTFITPEADLASRASESEKNEGELLLAPYCEEIVGEPAPTRAVATRIKQTFVTPLPDMALRLESSAMHAHLARLLNDRVYDILQIEGIEMAPYALALRGKLSSDRQPFLVFDDHNAEYLLQKRAFQTDLRRPKRWAGATYSWVQWQKLMRYERRICELADRVVAVSEADSLALRRLLPNLDVTVVPNGVDLEFLRPGVVPPMSELGPNALVYIGKMDYRPNVDAVLWFTEEVFPRILEAVPDAHFYIVGQQPHDRLASLAQHPSITITGRVPDVRPYIAAAGVYVVPLRIGGGTRLKVLEAMAMGQAIVSTRLGCDGFDFTDGREVCFADQPASFAAATVELLRDRQRAQQLGETARGYVEAFYDWDAIVPRFEHVFPRDLHG